METLCGPGKNRATARLGLAANGDNVGEKLARFENIEDCLGLVLGNVEANFAHHFHDERIQRSRLQAGALGFKLSTTDVIQKRFGHLAARAVVDADKKDFWF